MDGRFNGKIYLPFSRALDQPGTHPRARKLIRVWEKATDISINPNQAQVFFSPPTLDITSGNKWFRLDTSSGRWKTGYRKDQVKLHPAVAEMVPVGGVNRLQGSGFNAFFGFEVDEKIPHAALVPLYILRKLESMGGQPYCILRR